jgi:signal transduction histidine kinase
VNDDASTEAQLRASRARVLAAADNERREIERTLHDGVQQDLVALAVKVQLARRLADSDSAAAQRTLDEIGDDVHDALARLRALSETIYPSILAARGVGEALRGLAAATGSPIRIEAEELGRYSPEVEAGVYFCCREALEHAAARGTRSTLRIWADGDTLHFEVTGSSDFVEADLTHLRDRVEAVGGELTVSLRNVSAAIPLS